MASSVPPGADDWRDVVTMLEQASRHLSPAQLVNLRAQVHAMRIAHHVRRWASPEAQKLLLGAANGTSPPGDEPTP